MAYTTPTLNSPESIMGTNPQVQLKSLTDAYIGLRRELSYLLTHLNKGNGNALVTDVLISKIFSNDNGLFTGTMPNNAGDVAAVSSHSGGAGTIHVVPATGYVDGVDDASVITDADFVAGNIKDTVEIFGVTGTYDHEATNPITAATVLVNKIGFVNGASVTGTMPNRAGDTACLSSTVAGTTLKLLASDGYRDGTDDNVTITDADFAAGNIKNGTDIFGITGTLTDPVYSAGDNTQAKLFVSTPTELNTYTISLSYVTGSNVLSFTPNYSGTYRFTFTLQSGNAANTAYARMYDSVLGFIGTERSTTSTTAVAFTEDITVVGGRTITIYVKATDGTNTSVVYSFRCSTSQLSSLAGNIWNS